MISSRADGYTVGPIRKAMLLAGGTSSIALGVLTIVGAMEIEAWPLRLLFATFWFALGLLACVDLRLKVALRPEGVCVVNRLKTIVVPWNEFERFMSQRAYLRQYMGHVATRDGRTIPVQVLVTRGELGGLGLTTRGNGGQAQRNGWFRSVPRHMNGPRPVTWEPESRHDMGTRRTVIAGGA